MKAGTSGTNEPIWWEFSATEGEGNFASNIRAWQPSETVSMATQVLASGRYDVFFAPDLGLTITNAPRRTGSTEPPEFLTAIPGTYFDDTSGPDGTIRWWCYSSVDYLKADDMDLFTPLAGGCVWVPRNASGIDLKARATIENCFVKGFLTAGINVQCSTQRIPQSGANGFKVKDTCLYYNGGGINVRGFDANAGFISGLDIAGSLDAIGGYGVGNCSTECAGGLDTEPCKECVLEYMEAHVYTNEFGINDNSDLGCTWVGNQIAEVGGPAYIATGPVSVSTNLGQYVEGNCGRSRIRGAANSAFGGIAWAETTEPVGGAGMCGYRDWRQVVAQVWSTHQLTGMRRKGLSHLGTRNYGSFAFEPPATVEQLGVGDSYGMHYGLWADGNWCMALSGSPNRIPYFLTDERDLNGLRNAIAFPLGYQFGVDQYSTYFFPGDYGRLNAGIRNGRRTTGDRTLAGKQVTAGHFTDEICTQDGMNAQAWLPSTAHGAYPSYGPGTSAPSLCQVGEFVYRCAITGVTDTSPPSWPTTVSPANTVIEGRYKGVLGAASLAGTQCYRLGAVVIPRVDNGFMYRVSVAPSTPSGTDYGFTNDSTEPVWPTTLTQTVVDGELTWECFAVDDPSTRVTDGTTEWICVSPTAVWSRSNWIHNYGTATTLFGGSATAVIDLGELDNVAISVWEVKVKAAEPTTAGETAAFKLTGAWQRYYGTVTPLMSPTATTVVASAGAGTWSAVLQFNALTSHVEVLVTGDPLASDVQWECIRDVW